MITLKKKIGLFFLCLIMISFVGCSKKESTKLDIKVGFFPNMTHTQALMGKENKFQNALGEENNIQWEQFTAGSSEIEALLAGEIDLGYIGPGPAINGYIKSNGGLQIIAGACEGGAILISRSDVNIKNVKELSGKKVAIPQFGNTQHVVLKELLNLNGLKETAKGGNVEIVQADNPDIKTLFDKKAIDAALVPEPWGSRLIEESKANMVLDYNKVWREGKYPVTVVIARTDFIKQHPEIVEKFLKTHIELTDQANKNAEESKKTVNGQIKALTGKELSPNIMNFSFNRLLITNNPDKDAVKDMANIMKSLGITKGDKNIDGIFNFSIINKILQEKGEQPIK